MSSQGGVIDTVIVDGPEAKSEDERRDADAEEALERQRLEALAGHPRTEPAKRKRADIEEDRSSKRRRQQPGAVLLDTGRTRTMVTATTLVNLRPMLFMSSTMPWLKGPSMRVRRGACAACLLDAEQLIVVGGNEGQASFGTTEILDFRDMHTMSFRSGPRLSSQRRECAAVMLDADRLLVVGGYDGSHFLNTTEILDVENNKFVPGPRMQSRRASPAIAVLKTGHVVVVGGKNASGCLDTCEVLNPRATPMAFMAGPKLKCQRAGPALAPLDGGSRLLVMGGHDSSRTHSTTEILQIVSPQSVREPKMAFVPGPSLMTPRSYFAGVMLNAGNVHVIGGHDGYNYLHTSDVLNLASMEFTTGPCMEQRRFMCAAAVLGEERILVIGGSDVSSDHASTELLGLATYSFAPARWMREM